MRYEDLKKYFEEQEKELKRLGLYAPLVLLESNMDRLEKEMQELKDRIRQDLLLANLFYLLTTLVSRKSKG